MRALLIICLSLSFLFCDAQFNPQSKKITEKFFPEFEYEINTPAFQKKKGFTNYEELIDFINTLQAAHPDLVSISYIGESQKGKNIPLVKINKGASSSEKVKVWLQGGLHGNEPGSTEGVLFLMDQLLNNPEYNYLLDRLEFGIIPMANIDGYEKQDRFAANGLDLNRDQTKLIAPESKVLKQAFSNYGAELALDFHEYRPFRKDFAQMSSHGITSFYDVMFLYTGSLNVPEELRNYTYEKFVKNAQILLSEHELSSREYISSTKHLGDIHFNQGATSARSSATSYSLTNAVSSLIEVRGVGIGRTSFKRRVKATFLVGLSYLETAYQNIEALKKVIENANQAEQEASVKSKRAVYTDSISVIDIDTRSEIIMEITIRDALKLKPTLTRSRPFAYLILASEKAALENLKILGLELETLLEDTFITVEKYVVNEYVQAPEKYEKVRLQSIETMVSKEEKFFPKGTYVVYLNQAKANLAIEVLEPEASSSFVSFCVIKTKKDAELPIYRYLLKEKL